MSTARVCEDQASVGEATLCCMGWRLRRRWVRERDHFVVHELAVEAAWRRRNATLRIREQRVARVREEEVGSPLQEV
jgi:hypothetical protein